MFIFGIIAAGLAVLLSVAGFVIITFGLWRSFARDAFNRAIYLGLALISTAAIIFALSGPIFAGGLIFDYANGQNDEPSVSAPAYEEPDDVVPVEEDDIIYEESGEGYVDPFGLVSLAVDDGKCLPSADAESAIIGMTDLEVSGGYIVYISDHEAYLVAESDGSPLIVYVDSLDFLIYAANSTAYESSWLFYPEDEGHEPIDTDSDPYKVAEGCVS